MFTRILVPLEGTEEGAVREEQALAVARRLAAREGAHLVLLHVDANVASSRAATRAKVLAHSAVLGREGLAASVHFAYGALDESIVGAASEEGADLIVISPRPRPHAQTLLRPGVTREMVRHAPAPVLVWPEGLSSTRLDAALDATSAPVIVPLDGSPEAERALPLAEALAKAYGRSLLLMTVAAPSLFLGLDVPSLGVTAPVEAVAPEDRLQEGLHYLRRVRKEVAARTGLPVQTMGRIGPVAPEIADLAAAHPGCILVMTTHGRGRALRLLLGSVASELLRLTPAPLLIVSPQAQPQPQPNGIATAAAARMETEDAAEPEKMVVVRAG